MFGHVVDIVRSGKSHKIIAFCVCSNFMSLADRLVGDSSVFTHLS